MADNGANSFAIEDLHVQVEGKEILKGVTLTVNKGEVHALMGPNGSGKSTLANTLMGNPNYKVTKGRVIFKGQDILTLTTDERAKLGIFLAFQYPLEIPGVKINNFVRMALKAKLGRDVSPLESWRIIQQKMGLLEMDRALAERYVNEGFSGGEKKRNEILQMAVLEPEIAILDETDSGLDIDALKVVSGGINKLMGPQMGILVITHYQRILTYIQPNYVHVLVDGRIVRSGGKELAAELEESGYEGVEAELSGVQN